MAKKYKHIPSGVIVNEVIITGRSSGYGYRTEEGYDIPSWIVSGSDWEEVVEKSWVVKEHDYLMGLAMISIVRLKDGEVFKVGDKIKEGVIVEFYIRDGGDLWCCTDSKNQYGCVIELAQKEETLLFTTEDGYNVYQPNLEVYSVLTKGSWDTSDKTTYQRNGGFAKNGTMFTENSVWKHFHSKEKRDEYILNNKPCLSFRDVEGLLYRPEDGDRLMKIVKSKLSK